MDRRHFLYGLGTTTVSMGFAAGASQVGSVFDSTVTDQSSVTSPASRTNVCRVIGIGERGCMTVLSLSRTGAMRRNLQWKPEFICISAANAAQVGQQDVKTLSLCPYGCAGSVEFARTAALRNRTALRALIRDADLVFLVAGLGGGMGSGVSPMLAAWAREINGYVAAAVTLPFDFEGQQRLATAESAVRKLQNSADLVLQYPNEKLVQELDCDIALDDFHAAQDQRILSGLQDVMDARLHQQ